MAIWGAVMGGVSLLYQGAGWLEGGLTASFEKLILDAEMLQMMAEVLVPFRVDDAEIGIDAMAEVGPGGHHFATSHTLERYESAFYQPILSDWRNFETWQDDGGRTATERANRVWKQLLAEYEAPPLDAGRAEAVSDYVARRRREIEGSAGPG
jgi:trimethylamine--corrinoid protein Co-methyltransferase